jgi:hypothetical protein
MTNEGRGTSARKEEGGAPSTLNAGQVDAHIGDEDEAAAWHQSLMSPTRCLSRCPSSSLLVLGHAGHKSQWQFLDRLLSRPACYLAYAGKSSATALHATRP